MVGPGSRTVLIRGIGPTLGAAPFNLTGVAADPRVTLYAGTRWMAANDDWGGSSALAAAFTRVGAFSLANTSRDAALITTLAPGNYSVQITGAGANPGLALVEVYEIR